MFIALLSASAAPGVSTTALGLALTAPTERVLLVEADPIGGSPVHAGFLKGTREAADSRGDRSLINLVDPARRGAIGEAFSRQVLHIPTNDMESDTWLVPGLRTTGQADAMRDTWAPLGSHLAGLSRRGATVIVDAGRFGHRSGPDHLIRQADLIIIVCRTTVPAVEVLCGTRPPIQDLLRRHKAPAALGLITIGGKRDQAGGEDKLTKRRVSEVAKAHYTPGEASRATGLPLIHALPNDPERAAIFSYGAPRRRNLLGDKYIGALRETWPKMHTFIDSHGPEWIGRPDLGGSRAIS